LEERYEVKLSPEGLHPLTVRFVRQLRTMERALLQERRRVWTTWIALGAVARRAKPDT
jgi:hypothetical protein